MFATVNATAPWLRGLWITTIVASAVGLMIIFGYNGYALYAMRNHKEEHKEEEKTEETVKLWYFSIPYTQILCAIRFLRYVVLTVCWTESRYTLPPC